MKFFTALLFFICACTALAGDEDNLQKAAQALRGSIDAVPLNVVTPAYPTKALERGVEGWVVLRFVVKADGTTDEIEVFDSSIDGYFDEAAIEAASNKTYQPATIDGKPIMQGNVFLRSVFQMRSSDGGVGKSFQRSYRAASKALDDEDLELAKSIIDKLDAEEKRVLAEVCYLDMLKARYFSIAGDQKETLRYVERALVVADTAAAKPVYINLLKQAIVDNGRAKNYQASLNHYETLLEVDKSLAADDPVRDYVRRVELVVNSDSPIQLMGVIAQPCETCNDEKGIWRHRLNRNKFFINEVVGELNEITIVCQHSSVTVGFTPETAWTVNKDGGDCSITVFGEEQTSFQLVELAENQQL